MVILGYFHKKAAISGDIAALRSAFMLAMLISRTDISDYKDVLAEKNHKVNDFV